MSPNPPREPYREVRPYESYCVRQAGVQCFVTRSSRCIEVALCTGKRDASNSRHHEYGEYFEHFPYFLDFQFGQKDTSAQGNWCKRGTVLSISVPLNYLQTVKVAISV